MTARTRGTLGVVSLSGKGGYTVLVDGDGRNVASIPSRLGDDIAGANAARLALCWNTLEAFDEATVQRLGRWLAAHNGDDLNEMLEEEGIE